MSHAMSSEAPVVKGELFFDISNNASGEMPSRRPDAARTLRMNKFGPVGGYRLREGAAKSSAARKTARNRCCRRTWLDPLSALDRARPH